MFSYSFGCALQESVVKIEIGPVGNPMNPPLPVPSPDEKGGGDTQTAT